MLIITVLYIDSIFHQNRSVFSRPSLTDKCIFYFMKHLQSLLYFLSLLFVGTLMRHYQHQRLVSPTAAEICIMSSKCMYSMCILAHVMLHVIQTIQRTLVKPLLLLHTAPSGQKLPLQWYLSVCQQVWWGKTRKETLGRTMELGMEEKIKNVLDNMLCPFPNLERGTLESSFSGIY